MKKLAKIMGLATVGALVAGPAFAEDGNVVGTIVNKAANVFRGVRTIVFVLGGFGLVGLAMGAIFGKIQWKWFGALALGLVVLAVAGSIITFVTGESNTMNDVGGFDAG